MLPAPPRAPMPAATDLPLETARRLLCALGGHIREAVIRARDGAAPGEMAAVAGVTPAEPPR